MSPALSALAAVDFQWTTHIDSVWHELPYHVRELRNERGETLHIAAAWAGSMGESSIAIRSLLVKDGKVRITQTGQGVKVDINASVLFQEGRAALGPEARVTSPPEAVARVREMAARVAAAHAPPPAQGAA